MGQSVLQLLEMESAEATKGGACIGRVVRIEANGDVLVDFRGNRRGPIRARVATTEELGGAAQSVLLIFEDGNACFPVVAGVVRENIQRQEPKRSLTLEATSELTITCGKSSITLRRDGRVVIKGTELVSRASGTNKIRGATVKIN
jgi:hypothetical protein